MITSAYSATRSLQRARELGEAVLLDLPLRVQAERLLDPDLDPEALAVEAVLVALVEPAHRLVALEDVLERPPPAVVDAHRVVGRDRPVDEAPARAASVALPELLERVLVVPPLEDLALEREVVRHGRERLEQRHDSIVGVALTHAGSGNKPSSAVV